VQKFSLLFNCEKSSDFRADTPHAPTFGHNCKPRPHGHTNCFRHFLYCQACIRTDQGIHRIFILWKVTERLWTCRKVEYGMNESNISFESAAKFIHFGTSVTNLHRIHAEITSRLNSLNACYHSVHNLSSSYLLSKNIQTQVYTTTISLIILYGCETWSLAMRKEHRLRVFENWVLRKKANSD
jgi:hypothetical protein